MEYFQGRASRILGLITHEFGHQVFQGHNFGKLLNT